MFIYCRVFKMVINLCVIFLYFVQMKLLNLYIKRSVAQKDQGSASTSKTTSPVGSTFTDLGEQGHLPPPSHYLSRSSFTNEAFKKTVCCVFLPCALMCNRQLRVEAPVTFYFFAVFLDIIVYLYIYVTVSLSVSM